MGDRAPTLREKSSEAEEEEIKDFWCDPENPRSLKFEEVSAAAYMIRDGVIMTPCDASHMNAELDLDMYFKKDYMQFTGSFKERGARYTLKKLPADQAKRGVIAASAGNHAQALAYHGGTLGIPVTVVMPIVAPIMKVTSISTSAANRLIGEVVQSRRRP